MKVIKFIDNDKADRLEFHELQTKVEELKEIVEAFDEVDDDDEYDDEDSIEEDVLSLAKSGNGQEESEDQPEGEDFTPINKTPNNDKAKPMQDTFGSNLSMNVNKAPFSKDAQKQEEVHLKIDNSPIIKPIRMPEVDEKSTDEIKTVNSNIRF
jgi:hypothetical protein